MDKKDLFNRRPKDVISNPPTEDSSRTANQADRMENRSRTESMSTEETAQSKKPIPGNADSQLSRMLDAATQVSICATELDGTITLFNSGAENMLGYTADEMVGKQTPKVMHLASEVAERGEELSREFGREIKGFEVFVAYPMAGKFERREWTYLRKDGQHLTVNLAVTAVRNAAGEVTGFLGVAEDISDRKRSEEALRKSEERFELAVAGSNDGIWDWDILTDNVYYSPRFKELLGYRDDEFTGTFDAFKTTLHPDDQESTLEHIQRHLKDGTTYDVEYRLRRKSNEYSWFRARGQAVWNQAGQAVRMAGSLTDITKRKQAEAALESTAAEIQRANETLRLAEAEARKAVIERDKFLAMLSHELRNPLSAIQNGVGVLRHDNADRKMVAKAQGAIQRQVDHMSLLLDDLLDVARITQGKIGFHRQILDLNKVMYQAGEAIQPIMATHQHEFSIESESSPVMIAGDPTRLYQVIENLLTNAAKYTPPGGVITMKLQSLDDHCLLSVSDNGRGIAPESLEDIFDMFFQSNHALDRSEGGMGVGLTLVRALVDMHDGTVEAYSEGLEKGSRFCVQLPLEKSAPTKSSESSPATSKAKPRIVLIEDNQDSREMLQTMLQLDGFQVVSAADGQSGLETILKLRPDIAVIDIGLPIIDGHEVARRVRRQLKDSDILLIALTGYGQENDREQATQAGFDQHLVKPVDLEKLKNLLSAPRKPR